MRYAPSLPGRRRFRDVGKGEYADRPLISGVLPLPGLDTEGVAADPLGQGRRARGLVVIGIMAVFYSSFRAHPGGAPGWVAPGYRALDLHAPDAAARGCRISIFCSSSSTRSRILALAVVGVLQFFDVPGADKGLWRRRGEGATAEAPVEGTQGGRGDCD